MNQRTIYPYEIYNRPCSITYDTDDGNFVLVDMQDTMTVIQYPRCWLYSWCVRWAEQNSFPVPESFGGDSVGCLMFEPWASWNGNIMGIPREH